MIADDVQAPPDWLTRLRFWLWQSPDERRADRLRRMEALDQALQYDPESATLRVFRAELRLAEHDHEGAAEDFRLALDLAAEQIASEPWALVAQVMQDRARRGLAKTALRS